MITAITFDDLNPAFLPFRKLEELLDFLGKENVLVTLFAIPMGLAKGDYAKLLLRAQQEGHEVGQHGYRHSPNEFGYALPMPIPGYKLQRKLLVMGRDILRGLLGEEPLGFRAPNYRHNTTTLRVLKNLGFKYDSSKTVFKPTAGILFRVKTGVQPRITNLNGIIELPVTADYAYSNDPIDIEGRLKIAKRDFTWIEQMRGIFIINNHINFSTTRVFEFLHALIAELRNKTDFVRLRDLVP